jgi:CheY-like chemotaxis protein
MADQSTHPPAVERTGEFPRARPTLQKPTVLVLDDDWEICDVVEEVLTDAGFDVVCLPNGALGLARLSVHPKPAVILLDLMMPAMNGWTFVDRVREVPALRDIPIVVVTAAGPHWGYPVARVLHKPIERLELITTVREALHEGEVRSASA